jgi:hypothetical protein
VEEGYRRIVIASIPLVKKATVKSGRLFFWKNSDQSQQGDKTGCNLHAVIGACRPLAWMQESSSVAATSPELCEKIYTK